MKKLISILLILTMSLSNFAFAELEGIKVKVNNQEINSDVESTIIKDIPMVPVRAVFEALGLEVSWDGSNRMVTGKD